MANHVAPFFCYLSPSIDLCGTCNQSVLTERVQTKNLRQAEEDSILIKLKGAQDRGKPEDMQGSPHAQNRS